jgi:hypothetical protein
MEFVSWLFSYMVSGAFLNSNASDGWDIYNGWMMQETPSWLFSCMVSGTFLNSNASDGWDIYNGWMMQETPRKYSKPTYSKNKLFL